MKSILPNWIFKIIEHNFDLLDIQEVRIRKDSPVQICYRGKFIELKYNEGLYVQPIIATRETIDYILATATKNSLYAYEDQIRDGYIVSENGIRIGLCGTAVIKNNQVWFIKNITSLNIRFAHEVQGCSNKIMSYIIKNLEIKNTLIISEPGAGKTTLIRDVIKQMSEQFNIPNILVIDEKFEIAGENKNFNLGKNVDVIQGSNKNFAFYEAIKVMNPNVIVTDELISNEDMSGVKFAIRSGVKVIATAHANSIDQIKEKEFINYLIDDYFDLFIVLSKKNGIGTIDGIFDKNFKMINCNIV